MKRECMVCGEDFDSSYGEDCGCADMTPAEYDAAVVAFAFAERTEEKWQREFEKERWLRGETLND